MSKIVNVSGEKVNPIIKQLIEGFEKKAEQKVEARKKIVAKIDYHKAIKAAAEKFDIGKAQASQRKYWIECNQQRIKNKLITDDLYEALTLLKTLINK